MLPGIVHQLQQFPYLGFGSFSHRHEKHIASVFPLDQAAMGIEYRHPIICKFTVYQFFNGIFRLRPGKRSAYPFHQFFFTDPEKSAETFYQFIIRIGA